MISDSELSLIFSWFQVCHEGIIDICNELTSDIKTKINATCQIFCRNYILRVAIVESPFLYFFSVMDPFLQMLPSFGL